MSLFKAMLGEFSVENFALPPVDPEFEEKLKWVTERRKLAAETSKEDHFTPWSPSLDTTGLYVNIDNTFVEIALIYVHFTLLFL